MSAGRDRELAVLIVSYRRADPARPCPGERGEVPAGLPRARVGQPLLRVARRGRPRRAPDRRGVDLLRVQPRLHRRDEPPSPPRCPTATCSTSTRTPSSSVRSSRPGPSSPNPASRRCRPTVEDPEGREEIWDVAHREQGVLRNLLNGAGYAKRGARAARRRPAQRPLPDDAARGRRLHGRLLPPHLPRRLDRARRVRRALLRLRRGRHVAGRRPARRAGRCGWSTTPRPRCATPAAGTVADDPLASQRGTDLLRARAGPRAGQRAQPRPRRRLRGRRDRARPDPALPSAGRGRSVSTRSPSAPRAARPSSSPPTACASAVPSASGCCSPTRSSPGATR